MTRSVAMRGAMGLAVAGVFTTCLVVSSRSQQPPGGDRGNRPIARPVAMPPTLVGLEIDFRGVGDAAEGFPGEVRVSEGKVLDLAPAPGDDEIKVDGTRFRVAVKAQAAAKKKKAAAKKKNQAAGTTLRATLDAPPSARVTIEVGQARAEFALADLAPGEPKEFLNGRIAVERQEAAVRLTEAGTEDDHPSLAAGPDGTAWLAYVAYTPDRARMSARVDPAKLDTLVPEGNGDQVRLMRFDGQSWRGPTDVTGKGLDVWRPAVAVDGEGRVVVAWSQQVDGNWDVYHRRLTPAEGGGTWSEVARLTDGKGPDVFPVAATDAKGVVWLAWQSWRDGNFDIAAAALADGHAWAKPRSISSSKANDWSPAIAADASGSGRVAVAWDTYDKNQYDVRLRFLGDGDDSADSKPLAVAESPRFEGRPNLAFDPKGRLWIAYEEGDEQWGKDYASANEYAKVGFAKNPGFALYVNRTARVKCFADGALREPSAAVKPVIDDDLGRNVSLPRLAPDGAGGLWMTVRHHPLVSGQGEVWVSSLLHYNGRAWSTPRVLAETTNLMDNRPAFAPVEGGVLLVRSADGRVNTQTRQEDDLYASILPTPTRSGSEAPELVASKAEPEAKVDPVHPNEAEDVARMRAYRLEVGGKSLQLLRGEFHRHTEYTAHRDQDGLLEDSWRYALDAGKLDWMGNGDHDNGHGHEYMWWTIQKVADIYHNPPVFVAAQSYERSNSYPNGHRNVIMPRRGIRPLPRGVMEGSPEEGTPDTKELYAYLKKFGGMCSSHTSGTNMGTDWRDNDPEVEPVVEIYQGHRHSYEAPNTPRSATEETQIGGYRPAGYIWNALAKGYRLGFQSSSDHVSTHWSYAVVLTDDFSRKGLIDAFKKRHSYAATDNILLDVRSGDHLMGDEFATSARPTIKVVAHGTSPIARLHVIRDNTYAFSTEPGDRRVELTYTDDDADLKPGQTRYYYVRIEQADGNLAWSSPMWITYRP